MLVYTDEHAVPMVGRGLNPHDRIVLTQRTSEPVCRLLCPKKYKSWS